MYLICDAMDFNGLIVDSLRDALHHATGIGAKHLHIVTTHNHGLGDNEGLSVIRLSALVADGARRAMTAAEPARMAFMRVRTPGQWNFIRRFPFPAAGGNPTLFYGASPQDGNNRRLSAAARDLRSPRASLTTSGAANPTPRRCSRREAMTRLISSNSIPATGVRRVSWCVTALMSTAATGRSITLAISRSSCGESLNANQGELPFYEWPMR